MTGTGEKFGVVEFCEVLVGLLVGLLVAVFVGYLGISLGYEKWDHEVSAAAHPPGWVTRTATVESVSDVRYNVKDYQANLPDPPVVVADLRYQDYRSVWHDVPIDLSPDTVAVGDSVSLDVRNDESVYVPSAADWNNQVVSTAAPDRRAPHWNWPWLGYLLGIVGGAIAGGVSGFLAFGIAGGVLRRLSRLRGRLGTR